MPNIQSISGNDAYFLKKNDNPLVKQNNTHIFAPAIALLDGLAVNRAMQDSVAQLVEQYTFNVWVLGSNPSRITRGVQFLDSFFVFVKISFFFLSA